MQEEQNIQPSIESTTYTENSDNDNHKSYFDCIIYPMGVMLNLDLLYVEYRVRIE